MHMKTPNTTDPFRIIVLISGRGNNLQAIINATLEKKLPAQIQAVISNRPDAYGLKRAKQAGIPAINLDQTKFQNRSAFEAALISHIDSYNPDIIVLAGFMKVLSSSFVIRYSQKILNLHPSLLPKYPGLNTHERVLAAKETEHGATIHIVTDVLDAGPILAQTTCKISPSDTPQTLNEKILRFQRINNLDAHSLLTILSTHQRISS